jgi:hypothetical protein
MDFQALFDKAFLEDITHDVKYEVQMFAKTLGEQITTSATATKSPYEEQNFFFTARFYTQAQASGLTETDAIEVYNTGQEINEETIMRAYNGYEIGIEYTKDVHSGKPIFTSIWKREF